MSPRRRTLFPSATSDADHDRRYHLDLAALPVERAWAEQALLTHWLAERVFSGDRPAHLFDAVSDQTWARERLRRLRVILAGRRVA